MTAVATPRPSAGGWSRPDEQHLATLDKRLRVSARQVLVDRQGYAHSLRLRCSRRTWMWLIRRTALSGPRDDPGRAIQQRASLGPWRVRRPVRNAKGALAERPLRSLQSRCKQPTNIGRDDWIRTSDPL